MIDRRDFTFEDDERTAHRNWNAQRIAWVLVLVILIAVALGAAGYGPMTSCRSVSSDGKLQLDYHGVVHSEADFELRVRMLEAESSSATIAEVRLDRAYTDAVNIARSSPRWSAIASHDDETIYQWTGSAPPHSIMLIAHPERPGILRGRLSVGGSSVEFTQWCLP